MISKFFSRDAVNLDITYRCTLQCPACTRHYVTENGMKIQGHDMTDHELDLMLDKFDNFILCGNISDPIFHPNFIGFMKKFYQLGKRVYIDTAASHKPISWYKEAFAANPTARWKFGIDGLPHMSHFYRINQDGEKLFEVMKLCREMGLNTVWQYLIFSYNENNIEEARMLAKDIDVEFELVKTSRFPNKQQWMKPRNIDNVQIL